MKTIVRKDSKISLYLFDNGEVVNINAENTTIGNPVKLVISDCNTSNATLVENVTDPGDWTGWKYLYDNGWTLNPDWVDPESAE